MSHFTDVALVMGMEEGGNKAGTRVKRGGGRTATGECEGQINTLPVLQCISTRITVATAVPVSPLTEKNYKYYHLDH